MASELPANLKKVRRDLSDYVWHFTGRDGVPKDTLKEILTSKKLVGGNNGTGIPAVCFTEMPLIEAVRQSKTLEEHSFKRLSDFGIGFKTEWIFSKGGRPVIYGTWPERDKLPDEFRWRHCDLHLGKGVDLLWLREWRVPGKTLEFDSSDAPVVAAPTMEDAFDLCCSDYEEDPLRDEVFWDQAWSFVTHEQLHKAAQPNELEAFIWKGHQV